jgi:two-component system sensor histidine kinase VicK
MESPNGSPSPPQDKLTQLEAENQVLREENRQLRADYATALFKLEAQIAVEKRFEESQSRFQAIFYQSKMGNKIIAPDLRILQINAVFQQMLGYPEEEIIGTRIIAFAHPDFVQHWHELQENLWTRQIPSFQIETCLVKRDGSTLWCQVTSIIFRDNGETLGYTLVEDISRRKALEQDLKKLNEYRETIVHMVAHDLKSPINTITSLTGLLKKNLQKLPPEPVFEKKEQSFLLLQMISDTCQKAYTIIKDLLLIGELQSSHDFEQTDLISFLESQLGVLGVNAHQKGIVVKFDPPAAPLYASVNKDKFGRVLENLLSNAVKFTNPGGQVTISLSEEGRKIILQISDTGIGIPVHLQPALFNMFTKASRQGTQGETTTGLGLYIVKQIVEMHGGTIRVESRENAGTSFFIQLRQTGP